MDYFTEPTYIVGPRDKINNLLEVSSTIKSIKRDNDSEN